MYSVGYLHRDVSSGNILLVERGGEMVGVIMDLEYAKSVTSSADGHEGRTVRARLSLLGSPSLTRLRVCRGQWSFWLANFSLKCPATCFSQIPPSTKLEPPLHGLTTAFTTSSRHGGSPSGARTSSHMRELKWMPQPLQPTRVNIQDYSPGLAETLGIAVSGSRHRSYLSQNSPHPQSVTSLPSSPGGIKSLLRSTSMPKNLFSTSTRKRSRTHTTLA